MAPKQNPCFGAEAVFLWPVERRTLLSHPKLGASWEGFAIEQVLASGPHDEAYFGATYQGAEIDLILRRGDTLFGVECKRADAPRLTPSMRIAPGDPGVERVTVLYPGSRRYSLSAAIEVVPLAEYVSGSSMFSTTTNRSWRLSGRQPVAAANAVPG